MHSLSEWYACLAFHSLSYVLCQRSAMHCQHSVVMLSPYEVWSVCLNENLAGCPQGDVPLGMDSISAISAARLEAAASVASNANVALRLSECSLSMLKYTVNDFD